MPFFEWVFDRAPKSADPAGAQSVQGSPDETEYSLANAFCEIEYRDAAGALSRRAVTMIKLRRTGDADYLDAICHTRGALRSFRADRILAAITADGEVIDGPTFLRDYLKIQPAPPVAPPPEFALRQTPPRDFQAIIMAPMHVLAACGHADGRFHVAEIDQIMIWAETEALHLMRAGAIDKLPTIQDMDLLGKTIAMLRPSAETLKNHMVATLLMPSDAVDRFERALHRVIISDSRIHAAETNFAAEFARVARSVRRDPQAAIKFVNAATRGAAVQPQADLSKTVFVFTGTLSTLTRADAMAAVRGCGGAVKGHLDFADPSRSVYLVAGAGGGQKRDAAAQRGIPILTEAEFLAMLGLG